jgi:PAS domain S-box-containing protein
MTWRQPFSTVRESFQSKILILFIVVIVILASSFTALYVRHEKTSQMEKLLTEGNLLASILAYNVRLPVFAENIPMLESAIDGIVEHKLVLAVAIYGEDGRVLAERFRPDANGAVAVRGRTRQHKPIAASRQVLAADSIEFYVPVVAGIGSGSAPEAALFFEDNPQGDSRRVIGLVNVMLDRGELNRRIGVLVVQSVTITIFFMAMGSLAAFLIVRGVSRPLSLLAAGARELGAGDLSIRVPVTSNDEVGEVADAFNAMVASLQRREGENRRLAEELRLVQQMEARNEWERTFDTVPDLIAILDGDQRVVRANRAFVDRFGLDKEAVVGMPCVTLLPVQEGDGCSGSLPAAAGGGSRDDERELYVESLDSYYWITVTPLRNIEGELIGSVLVARDISDRKRVEEERKVLQAKLIQTNKMTSLGLLVSGMAHEVNNPNNNIKLAAHLLLKAWEDAGPILDSHFTRSGDFMIGGFPYSQARGSFPGYITGIAESSRRIEGIIKNLRDFVRKGKANVNASTDINMVVTVAAAILNYQIKKFTGDFTIDLSEGLPPVRGNTQLLEQVVINLIMNALQALPDRNGAIRITTFHDGQTREVLVKVQDSGSGMTPEVMKRLFEPFFSTKLDRGGTGLGLAISNVILSEHQGSLEFETRPGGGTTAIIRLPSFSPS